ncbi:MAG: glycosyltransferase family 2 protein [Planctomycetaceae bacterium]|jgi:glycosyltransferase involved in cell wall biosynthesis
MKHDQIDPLPITVLIAAKNEEANMAKCLAALTAFARVVVIDSASTDNTASVSSAYGAEVADFEYQGGYPKKRQWAIESLNITTPWTLLLDADEVVPRQLISELRAVVADRDANDAYLVTKGFHFLGRRLRFGGFSHAAILLFRSGQARFEHLLNESKHALDMEVHERLVVDGSVGKLNTALIHEDFKGLEAYLTRHNNYSTWEASVRSRHLSSGDWGTTTIKPRLLGNAQERRRFLKQVAIRVPFEPWLWFAYHFVFRLGFLEGRRGLIASQIRCSYIAQVRSKLYELSLQRELGDATLPFVRRPDVSPAVQRDAA